MNNLVFSSDKSLLNEALIHNYLTNSYWAKNIPLELVQTAIQESICFAAYQDDHQIAFARVVTDQVSFAYLADVFVLPEFQGKGIGKMLMASIIEDSRVNRVRRFMLMTKDAHELYEKFGFASLDDDDTRKIMQCRFTRQYEPAD